MTVSIRMPGLCMNMLYISGEIGDGYYTWQIKNEEG